MTIHDPDLEEAGSVHSLFRDLPSSVEFNKLRKRLMRNTRQAIEDFAMAKPGDRWLVALSGGKDSYGMLALLLDLKWRGLLPVDLIACNLDQGQPNFPKHILPDFLDANGIAHRIEPPAEYKGNAYEARGVPRIPRALWEAAQLLEESTLAREIFGEEVVEHYVNTARVEQEAYDSVVTCWERQRYLERG